MRGGVPPGGARRGPAVQRAGHQPHPSLEIHPSFRSTAAGWLRSFVRPDARACVRRVRRGLARRARAAHGGGRRARTQEEARSFIVSSLRRRLGLVICREFARRRIRRVPYIGVPRAVGRAAHAASAASSSGDRRRECRSTCRTPTSSSTSLGRRGLYYPLARDGWPAARKRARTPHVPQGGRGARAP